MAAIGANQGFVLCAPGTKICSRGRWTACASQATSAPISAWQPESAGCDAPAAACESNGTVRRCRKQLPPAQSAADCYDGTQECSGGFWGPCIPSAY
jgi:hypothetical protein